MSPMKVACLGNMNHIFFSLTRFLRDRGVAAELLLSDDEFEHFLPASDSFDDEYTAYTRQLSWGSASSYFRVGRKTVAHDLAPYDVVLGCGFAPAFCESIGRRLDFFIPYGADVELFPFGVSKEHWFKRYLGLHLGTVQRRGIEHARRFYCPDVYAPFRRALERLAVPFERRTCAPVYFPMYEKIRDSGLRSQLKWASRFDELRARYEFLLFSPTRHFWKLSHKLGYGNGKGNDLLIRGFADYVRGAGRRDVGLILFEYGGAQDIAASKQLVVELRVGEQVHWLPPMARREVMYGASLCDAGADQFPGQDQGGAYGGTLIELMSLGKPVFGQLLHDPEEFRLRSGCAMPPLVNASSSEQLARLLDRLVESPAHAADLGRRGAQWMRDSYGWSVVDHYIAEFDRVVEERATGSR